MAICTPLWRVLLMGWAVLAAADSLQPTNWTNPTSVQSMYSGQLYCTASGSAPETFNIVPLTLKAAADIAPKGYSGQLVLVNSTNQPVAADALILISCDPGNYPGNIQALDILSYYANSNVGIQAAVFFSLTGDYCSYNGSVTGDLYSTKTVTDGMQLLQYYRNVSEGYRNSVTGEILGPTNNATAAEGGNPSNTNEIAMIVLYSITGIITCLFLAVIIIGGVRAHRHPERYGPRAGLGRTRQSRARGLARAMLDTLPIVRFGEREGDSEAGKAAPIEMAEGSAHGPVLQMPSETTGPSSQLNADASSSAKQPAADVAAKGAAHSSTSTANRNEETGIAAAQSSDARGSSPTAQSQECIICTDEFEVGQDQRVLPCNHRFHPACIDPWLLNVSGTCPLCRIDLNAKGDASVDEERAGMAPPLVSLGDQGNRISTRRLFMSAMGTAAVDHMTLEERVSTLRDMRRQQQATRRSARPDVETSGPDEGAEEDDENRVRRALRNVFHIRTRRTGEEDALQDNAASANESDARSPHASSNA